MLKAREVHACKSSWHIIGEVTDPGILQFN